MHTQYTWICLCIFQRRVGGRREREREGNRFLLKALAEQAFRLLKLSHCQKVFRYTTVFKVRLKWCYLMCGFFFYLKYRQRYHVTALEADTLHIFLWSLTIDWELTGKPFISLFVWFWVTPGNAIESVTAPFSLSLFLPLSLVLSPSYMYYALYSGAGDWENEKMWNVFFLSGGSMTGSTGSFSHSHEGVRVETQPWSSAKHNSFLLFFPSFFYLFFFSFLSTVLEILCHCKQTTISPLFVVLLFFMDQSKFPLLAVFSFSVEPAVKAPISPGQLVLRALIVGVHLFGSNGSPLCW